MTSEETPSQRLRALLRHNKQEATRAEQETARSTFWNYDVVHHYLKRAETLETVYSGPGKERAVFALLKEDGEEAEQALAASASTSNLSAAYYAHRDARDRYARAGLEREPLSGPAVWWKTQVFDASSFDVAVLLRCMLFKYFFCRRTSFCRRLTYPWTFADTLCNVCRQE